MGKKYQHYAIITPRLTFRNSPLWLEREIIYTVSLGEYINNKPCVVKQRKQKSLSSSINLIRSHQPVKIRLRCLRKLIRFRDFR